tara:strand:+ start:685 stop:1125 length:441 start_codon:yes stop_codon:yes gene_type:complete
MHQYIDDDEYQAPLNHNTPYNNYRRMIIELQGDLAELVNDWERRFVPGVDIPYYTPRGNFLRNEDLEDFIREIDYFINHIYKIKQNLHEVDQILREASAHKDMLYGLYRPGYRLNSYSMLNQRRVRRRSRLIRSRNTRHRLRQLPK